LASGIFEAVGISSDSDEILEVSRAAGAKYLVRRPDSLATDQAAKLPAIRHALLTIEEMAGTKFDLLVDLAATSPVRISEDIVATVALLEEEGVDIAITGAPSRNPPYFSLVERDPQGGVYLSKTPPANVVRRQDAPPSFDMNGSVYAWRRSALVDEGRGLFGPRTRLHEMPHERSFDIDTELDWDVVEFVIERARRLGNFPK
jgi:CMP-N-acetylneuraminic acid synthetase